jgi:hypothetical protein
MLAASGGHTGVASLLVNAKVGIEAECSKVRLIKTSL